MEEITPNDAMIAEIIELRTRLIYAQRKCASLEKQLEDKAAAPPEDA